MRRRWVCSEAFFAGNSVSSSVLRRIYIGAVQPKMEYACAVWCGGPIGKLLKLKETFCQQARVSMPPLQRRFDYHALLLFYKIRSEVAPTYLSSSLLPPLSSSSYKLRKMSYPVPKVSKKSTPCQVFSLVQLCFGMQFAIRTSKDSLTLYFQKSATLSPESLT